MRYALSKASRKELRKAAREQTLYAFDFDGTLAPIVKVPERAVLRPTTRALLSSFAGVRPCVLISGRALSDLRARAAGIGFRALVGNHGAEPWEGAGGLRPQVEAWARILSEQLPPLPGLWIENKTYSLTVHYRECRRKDEVRAAIGRAARSLAGVRLVEGAQACNLVAARAPRKGDALLWLWARARCNRAVYVGDDETDEDVFALTGSGLPLLSIRVGRKLRSQAGYYLRNQSEIDGLLSVLVEFTPGRSSQRG